jgi:FkbM family methyltransferase
LIGRLVKPGDHVLNLGSQSGLEALVMGKIIGETGKLFIFEPYSFSNSLITKNVEINGLKDITTIYKYGASDEKGMATIKVSYSNTGGS